MAVAKKKKSRETWGQIDPLPSGRYRARYTHLEHRFTAPHTFTTIGDARNWLSDVRRDISRGEWRDPRQVSSTVFGVYAAKWVDQRRTSKGDTLRQKTRSDYQRSLRVGLAPFADVPIAGISSSTVRGWHAARAETAPTAAGADARLLRAILNTAIEDGLIESNPVAGNLCRSKAGRKFRPPTLDELGALIREMPEKLHLAVIIAAYGSARLSEWRGLRRKEVGIVPALGSSPAQPVIRIERQVQHVDGYGWDIGRTKSEEGERNVFLPSVFIPLIESHLERYVDAGPDALLFKPEGEWEYLADHTWRKYWDHAREVVGVLTEVREHDLRRFATLRETMAFLGHSTTSAAMTYQATTGRESELAERMPIPASLR
jgi:hypothetical protein